MHRPLLTLAERLGEVLPERLDSVFFSNSGSEAVEAALRLARHATGPAQHRGVPRLVPRPHHRRGLDDDLGHQVPRRLLADHGRRRRVAVPHGVPLRLGRADRHRVRAARAGLRAGHGDRARPRLRRSSSSRCSAKAATCRRTPRSCRACASAPTGTASCSSSTRCRPAGAAPAGSGATTTSACGPTSWSPRRAWPAGSRSPPSPPPPS